jgi:nitrous oxidase accessory protein NosD
MTLRFLLLAVICATTAAAQTVVSDDASLRRALRGAKPGDNLRIAPGTYSGSLYAEIQGTKERRIVVEAADPANPPLIKGGGNGMQLARATYVTVLNLHFRGAADNGINIDDGGTDTRAIGIVVEGLVVEDIGPKGNHDGIKLSGLKDFAVRDCTVAGWGGNAIDLVGCSDGVIERCTVRGKDGLEQRTATQRRQQQRHDPPLPLRPRRPTRRQRRRLDRPEILPPQGRRL